MVSHGTYEAMSSLMNIESYVDSEVVAIFTLYPLRSRGLI